MSGAYIATADTPTLPRRSRLAADRAQRSARRQLARWQDDVAVSGGPLANSRSCVMKSNSPSRVLTKRLAGKEHLVAVQPPPAWNTKVQSPGGCSAP